jgi:hypothetical protein
MTANDRKFEDPDFQLYEAVLEGVREYNSEEGDHVEAGLYDNVESTRRQLEVPLATLSSVKSALRLCEAVSVAIGGSHVDLSLERSGAELKGTLHIARPPAKPEQPKPVPVHVYVRMFLVLCLVVLALYFGLGKFYALIFASANTAAPQPSWRARPVEPVESAQAQPVVQVPMRGAQNPAMQQ